MFEGNEFGTICPEVEKRKAPPLVLLGGNNLIQVIFDDSFTVACYYEVEREEKVMNENKRGYWIYSIVTIVVFVGLFAFWGWLIYDLIIKLSDKDFSNNTVVQALITLVVTVFIGGYFNKWLEIRNAKKLELYKIQTAISLKLIDLASAVVHNPDNEQILELLICESSKVKLYFPDSVLKELNSFIQANDKKNYYDPLINELRKNIK